jgi:hypothetical protein
MPNRFTRVPERPVPALPLAGRLLLPLADAFMLLMVSRPATGSLRRTWVTPGTLWLCAAVVVAGVPVAALALAGGGGRRVAAGLVVIALAAGSAAVLAVGAMQRR